MTPAARLQAAIDLLDAIIAAATGNGPAADTLIARYFRERRYAGSKDRRAVRDHVYAAIRAHASPPASGRVAMVALAERDPALAALFDGSPHAPPSIGAGERGAGRAVATDPIPAWLSPALAALVDGPERAALLERAPLHLRANSLKTDRAALLAALPDAMPLANTTHGLALPEGTPLESTPQWQQGLIEVQDAGSQIIAAACQARPGHTILDLCAGAGGKTLALAGDMAGKGRLIAADVNRDRLSRLAPRAERASATGIETLLLNGGREAEALASLTEACDVVLVDAPCTGMGTWRRNPEARWRLTPDAIARMAVLQSHVLRLAAPLVKPGEAIVYAVCSLLDAEGRDQVDAFLALHPGWVAEDAGPAGRPWGQGRLLTAKQDGSDGFFFARLRKA
ncbi:RsmB/NOP family class I SAM-dependent RNA methyltransferase [Sphingobium sufflavum]|uniref:RsmB/NOP family class I SAM-dependent RNA methyltransferase n=1 Tax=Sphingobium sufflavum TaxID=1129547 RepID=UPI001F1BBF6F|nr:RsmB/NOP family class I SAM-dependent RNA methyltransferase [Sphingobium sufflavum]MCE7798362.1 RsmB/NOP family class I SAM-dependent RNA methyltransferase [Sphingobium sufflavum]